MNDKVKEILDNIKNKYDGYLVCDIVSGDDLKLLLDYINKLQSNWNSLREWLTQLKNSYMETDNIFDDAKFRILLTVLDKMNELEGKDKE